MTRRKLDGSVKDRGAVVVEFAFVAPILIAMFIAIIEFSYIWNFNSQLNDATLAAARYYAVPRVGITSSAMQTQAESIVASGVQHLPSTVNYQFCVDSSSNCGSSVLCPTQAGPTDGTVLFTVTATPPTLTRFFGSSFTATAKAVVPCG